MKPALHVAVEQNDAQALDCLLDLYPDISNIYDFAGHTALDYAIGFRNLAFISKLTIACPSFLTQKSYMMGRYVEPPLFEAVTADDLEVVQAMLTAAPDAASSISRIDGGTLLHYASRGAKPKINMMRYLLSVVPTKLYARQDIRGTTAMHLATISHQLDVVQLLNHADSKMAALKEQNTQRTPLDIAVTIDDVKIVDFLLTAQPDLIQHCRDDIMFDALSIEIMQRLYDLRPNLIFAVRRDRESLLHHAVQYFRAECVARLITLEPSLVYCINDFCVTPLQVAMRKSDCKKVNTILEHAPFLHEVDRYRNTTLHFAVTHCTENVLQSVFQHNQSCFFCENADGDTPFALAANYENFCALNLFFPHATVEMIVETKHTPTVYFDLHRRAKTQCATICDELLPRDLRDIVFAFLEL